MIPQGRETMTEADVAGERGYGTVKTWREREGAAFRSSVRQVNPGERLRLYYAEQARAWIAGKRIPRVPGGSTPHPDDLLSDKEAGPILGVTAATVRAMPSQGQLSAGVEVHGSRRWSRREIDQLAANPGQHGAPRGKPTADERARIVADWLAEYERGQRNEPTAKEVADAFDISRSSAYTTLAAAASKAAEKRL